MPHVAIADTGSAAASLLNGLNAAANQAAERKDRLQREKDVETQRSLQQDFSNALELQKNNYVPASLNVDETTGRPTLKLSDEQAKEDRSGPTILDPHGQMYRQKTKEQLAAEDPSNFIPKGALAQMLEMAGRDPKKPISPAESHTIMESLNAANHQMDGEPYDIDLSGKWFTPDGKPVPVMIGKKTGRVHLLDLGSGLAAAQPAQPGQPGAAPAAAPTAGGGDSGGGMPGGAFDSAPAQPGAAPSGAPGLPGTAAPLTFNPAKPAKPKAVKNLRFEKDTNDRGDVIMRGFDPETGELVSTNIAKGIGGTKHDPNAAEKKPPAASLRLIVDTKNKALQDATDAYTKAVAPVGGSLKVKQEVKDEAALTMRRAHVQAQLAYEEALASVTGKDIPHNDWADKALAELENPPETKATAKPAQPVAAPAPAAAAKAATGAKNDPLGIRQTRPDPLGIR